MLVFQSFCYLPVSFIAVIISFTACQQLFWRREEGGPLVFLKYTEALSEHSVCRVFTLCPTQHMREIYVLHVYKRLRKLLYTEQGGRRSGWRQVQVPKRWRFEYIEL